MSPHHYPVQYGVDYPEAGLSRLTTFFRMFTAIPVIVILYFWAIAASIVLIISWFAIVFTKRFPRGMFDFLHRFMNYTARATAYIYLQTDKFPSFSDEQDVHLRIPYPEQGLSRWLPFVKWLLAIPHLIVISILAYAVMVVVFIAWFAILFTGTYPRGMFDFVTGVTRWTYRMYAYTNLMRDEYPPFSMDGPNPGVAGAPDMGAAYAPQTTTF